MFKFRRHIHFIINALFFLCWSQATVGQHVEIWEIQGVGTSSPYDNDLITTSNNIVTAVGEDQFFIQTPTDRSDNNPLTSDGICVYTGSTPNVEPGMLVTVTARVDELDGNTQLINFPVVTIEENSVSLPNPVVLNADFPSANPAEIHDLERVEGMLVQWTGIATGAMNEEEIISVVCTENRPFREPGIIFPGDDDENLPVWDGNPEIFWFDPNGLSAPNNRYLGADMLITASSVMVQDEERYVALPTTYNIQGSAKVRAVRDREENELTVASLNAFLLYQSTDNYLTRLQKVARYIVQSLKSPDIVALQEVGNLTVLQDLILYIRQIDPSLHYSPHIGSGNDLIRLAFLTRNSVNNVQITELEENAQLSLGGILHDRPPLLLEASINTVVPTEISVLNVHTRSLLGIEGSQAYFVRTKRHEQALSIANIVQANQNKNLIVLGDFNAYEFSDGYVDVVNQIAGSSSLGAQWDMEEVVDPPLTNQMLNIDPFERYSFVFRGTAQLIDHCLTNQFQGMQINGLEFARGNADNSEAYLTNELIVHRSSDHDGFVLFLKPESPLAVFELGERSFELLHPNPLSSGDQFQIISEQETEFLFQLFSAEGRLVYSTYLEKGTTTFQMPISVPPGFYVYRLSANGGSYSNKLLVKE